MASCWREVSNAGGAVGFPFPPVDEATVMAATRRLADEVAAGSVRLQLAEAEGDAEGIVGWVALRLNLAPIARHWARAERPQCRVGPRSAAIPAPCAGRNATIVTRWP